MGCGGRSGLETEIWHAQEEREQAPPRASGKVQPFSLIPALGQTQALSIENSIAVSVFSSTLESTESSCLA